MIVMARPHHGDGSMFAQPRIMNYPANYGYATRPGFLFQGPCATDMDSLKAAISQAVPGTGQVKHAITAATFQPRAPAFTSLIQTCAKFREAQKALEIFDTMQTSDAIDVKPNKVHYRSVSMLSAPEVDLSMSATSAACCFPFSPKSKTPTLN